MRKKEPDLGRLGRMMNCYVLVNHKPKRASSLKGWTSSRRPTAGGVSSQATLQHAEGGRGTSAGSVTQEITRRRARIPQVATILSRKTCRWRC